MNTHFTENFVGGRRVASSGGDIIEVRSPYDGAVVGSAPLATLTDIDAAIGVARAAFDNGPWPRMSVAERIEILAEFMRLYEQKSADFAALVSREMGAPSWFANGVQNTVRKQSEVYLRTAETYPWEAQYDGGKGTTMWIREPVGVVAAIIPWNAPHQTALAKLFPALLAGCTVVLKLATEAPIDGQYIGELFSEAGLPEGVLSILVAERDVSERLVVHPDVDKIGFTGSTAAGCRIASLAGAQMKRFSLELGGKSAAIVLDDADIDETVKALKFRSFPNNGQVCVAQTRILVPRNRHDAYVDRLAAMVGEMIIGDPSDPDTFLGPLVSARQQTRVTDYIQAGIDGGADLVVGGLGMPEGINHGYFVKPTLFANVDNTSRVAQEEIFGPVVCVIPYEGADDAVRIANESEFGLAGSVWTSDVEKGVSIARQVRTGGLSVNTAGQDLACPAGGYKKSGVGREFGSEAINHYVEHKTVAF